MSSNQQSHDAPVPRYASAGEIRSVRAFSIRLARSTMNRLCKGESDKRRVQSGKTRQLRGKQRYGPRIGCFHFRCSILCSHSAVPLTFPSGEPHPSLPGRAELVVLPLPRQLNKIGIRQTGSGPDGIFKGCIACLGLVKCGKKLRKRKSCPSKEMPFAPTPTFLNVTF